MTAPDHAGTSPVPLKRAPKRSRTKAEWAADMDGDLTPNELRQLDSLNSGLNQDPLVPPVSFPARSDELRTPLDSSQDNPVLPGSGLLGKACGDIIKAKCRVCGKVFDIEHACMGRLCPSCYEKWAAREARLATAMVILKYHADKVRGDRLVHAVVSIAGDPGEIFARREWAIKAFRRHGLEGFVMVCHHVREGKDVGQEWAEDGYIHYHAVGVVGADGFHTIPAVIESEFLTDNPFHAYGPRPPRAVVTGTYNYVFKVLRQKAPSHRGWTYYLAETQIFRRLYYNLSHAAIGDGRHAISWAGSWFRHAKAMLMDARRMAEGCGSTGPICPKCGSDDLELGEKDAYERPAKRRAFVGTMMAGDGVVPPNYVPPWKRDKKKEVE